MEFKTPIVLFLIIIFIAVYFFLMRRLRSEALIFSSVSILDGVKKSFKTRIIYLPIWLRIITGILLLVALAGPRQILDKTNSSVEGIDIVLAIDCSLSMAAEDFQINNKRINRLDVVKTVVADFISQRTNDRIGLIAFGGRAYTVCPLTNDHAWLKENLARINLGIVEDGTAIGSGLASAVSRLKNSKAKSKVVILLTDGMNNAGTIEPLAAADAAKHLGIKVYTVGAGTKGMAPYPVTDVFGRRLYQNVKIDIDESMLSKIAETTSAKYYRATDTDSLKKIYQDIDFLEKTSIERDGYREYRELFSYFLIAALILLMIEILLSNTILLRIP